MKTTFVLTASLLFTTFSSIAGSAEQFKSLSPEQALEQANQWYGSKEASVQVFPDHIVGRFAENEEVTIPVINKHLISIAPYINQTHPCTYHVPTGCTGELRGVSMHVAILNTVSGEVVVDKEMTTEKNGFADFWLPKSNDTYQVTVTYQGKTAVKEIVPQGNAPTCITDMQLI